MCTSANKLSAKKALDLSVASCGYIGRVHYLSHEIPYITNRLTNILMPYLHVNVFLVALHDANALSAISLDVALSLLSGVWTASGAFSYF